MTNNHVIRTFYDAFQRKDVAGMIDCYAKDVVFNDPVFTNLSYQEVCGMWRMLVSSGKDLELTYKVLEENATSGVAEWTATYTFSKTGRKVVNRIYARFELKDGKILRHTDVFDFYNWSRQALGWSGLLFGKTNFLREKVQGSARASLVKYMQKNP